MVLRTATIRRGLDQLTIAARDGSSPGIAVTRIFLGMLADLKITERDMVIEILDEYDGDLNVKELLFQ